MPSSLRPVMTRPTSSTPRAPTGPTVEEVIDLGAIAEQTHGSAVNFADTDGGQRILPGLSDD
jgi:hypothetical protein